MSLPPHWVDRIFEKLAVTYGREFLGRWDGIPIENVKADWAHELAGFAHLPEAIAHALKNMPADKPPTVLQFRDMCRRAPPKQILKLDAPRADPARVKLELAKVLDALKQPSLGNWRTSHQSITANTPEVAVVDKNSEG
jgi:hypothetical protein